MELVERLKKRIEDHLYSLFPLDVPYPQLLLHEAARYTLFAEAKRIRPLLTLLITILLGEKEEKSLQPACALEIVHTYSLIHDDLPCMDDDDYRRGQPSLHRAYNEAHALLTGDFLLTYAFEILMTAPHLSEIQKNNLILSLTRAIGAQGMLGGQVLDVTPQHKKSIRQLHLLKTALLFQLAAEFAALIATSSKKIIYNVRLFGRTFGLLFQMLDDFQDQDSPLNKENILKQIHVLKQETLKSLKNLPGDTYLIETLVNILLNKVKLIKI